MTITRNLIVKGLQELNDTSYMEALTAEVAEGIGGECWLHLRSRLRLETIYLQYNG